MHLEVLYLFSWLALGPVMAHLLTEMLRNNLVKGNQSQVSGEWRCGKQKVITLVLVTDQCYGPAEPQSRGL